MINQAVVVVKAPAGITEKMRGYRTDEQSLVPCVPAIRGFGRIRMSRNPLSDLKPDSMEHRSMVSSDSGHKERFVERTGVKLKIAAVEKRGE
jgi:hypothetical protein